MSERPPLTPLGEYLEHGRRGLLHISMREAARRAGVSEAWWRQVITGRGRVRGADAPARPTARVVVAMALAVDVDPHKATELAELEVSPEAVAAIAAELGEAPPLPEPGSELADELKRIEESALPLADRLAAIRALIALHVEGAAARRERDTG